MIPCEVVNANNTGKPCPNPGTETAELVYPSGVSETKRCCPEHAAMVQKASAAARSVLAARAEARRAESDARAERLAALRTARAIRPVAELPPADPVPPVIPVTEIPTMPDPTSTTTPPKPARGKPAPKPERSSLGGVLACRACGKSASYPLCKADRERVRKLRLLKLLPADFDAKTSPISILDEAWAAFEARKARPVEPDPDKHRADALLDAAIVNGETNYVPDPRDAEIAGLRAALEGQTLANATLPERVVAAERERDEAVRSIAALRADADELRALREALTTGKAGRKLAPASLDALAAADERLLRAAREQARPHDDRTVGVLRFATERILDSIATASKDGRPADLGLLEAVRVIATGKVPEVSDVR